MVITVSAPGKVHLLGEHSAVYGYPALLSSINRRLTVTLTKLPESKDYGEKLSIQSNEETELIYRSLEIFQKSVGLSKLPAFQISVKSDIPVGTGLGSSAALSVALIGALFKAVRNLWNPVKINELAYEVEKLQHKNPSGGDNTIITFGGLVWYRKETEFLKSIWNLPSRSYHLPHIILIDSGRPNETTGEMVSLVNKLYSGKKKFYEDIFIDQERETRNLLVALKNGDTENMKRAFYQGEKNLEKMGVVGKKAQSIIRSVEKLGGVAKISGGGGITGGSGMILCYHTDFRKIKEVAKKFECTVYDTHLGEEGVRIEKGEGISPVHGQ